MRKFLIIAGFLFSFSLAAVAQESPANNENDAVRQLVQAYLNDNVELKKRALHPDAKIISVDGRGRVVETLISKRSKQRAGAAIALPEQRIAAVDVTVEGASVKVETEFPADKTPVVTPRKHIQYISLLKVSGEWKIVSILMPSLKFAEVATK